jgi:predicted HAD superfamily phosphohydrolase YqeG
MNDNRITTLIFDWGDTILVDDGRFSGKMMYWPEIQTIHGVEETLATLSRDYQIVLATNAEDSTYEDIKLVLRSVNLENYFSHIFTTKELRVKKPNPHFFIQIIKKLKLSPENVAAIGNDYKKDIISAKLAGLRSIWFNPSCFTAEAHIPMQDMDIRSFSQLPQLLSETFLPDFQTCYSWYAEQGVTHTLFAHILNVAAIAYQISLWFDQKGFSIKPLLAHRGGMTHDISKLQDETEKNHAIMAYEFLRDKGQFELAEIARTHLIGDLLNPNTKPTTWEQKIVNYADKLSEGSKLVSLDERLAALQKRYPDFAQKIQENTPLIKALENEIVTALDSDPDLLLTQLRKALFLKNGN